MASVSDLVNLRNETFNTLGNCRATRVVTLACIAAIKEIWGKDIVVVAPVETHKLLTLAYQDKVRAFYGSSTYDKISTIRYVRSENDLGLKDAKDYVEWICEHYLEPAFVRNLPGYIPF